MSISCRISKLCSEWETGETDLNETILQLKTLWKVLFGDFENTISLLKFHMIDHIVKDVARFGNLNVMDAASIKTFNYIQKCLSENNLYKSGSTLEEAVALISSSVSSAECSSIVMGRESTVELARAGISATLADIATFTFLPLARIVKDA